MQSSHLDYKVSIRLAGVIDLIAAEDKYHLTCLSAFTRYTFKTKEESTDTELAVIWLGKELHQAADRGHVLPLDGIWLRNLQPRFNIQDNEEILTLPKYDPQDDMLLSLIHVTLKICGYMMATPGHQGFSQARIRQYHAFQIVYIRYWELSLVITRP